MDKPPSHCCGIALILDEKISEKRWTNIIEKLLKPIERKQLYEDDMQEALTDSLKDLLPTDTKVNEEAGKLLVTVAPDIKEAALSNPRLDGEWLGASL